MMPPEACCTLTVAELILTGKVTLTFLSGELSVTAIPKEVFQSYSLCSLGWLLALTNV